VEQARFLAYRNEADARTDSYGAAETECARLDARDLRRRGTRGLSCQTPDVRSEHVRVGEQPLYVGVTVDPAERVEDPLPNFRLGHQQRMPWVSSIRRSGDSLPSVAQWRLELGAEDVAALSRGEEITVVALDDESESPEDSIEITVVLREY
jgi:hypothetical protein